MLIEISQTTISPTQNYLGVAPRLRGYYSQRYVAGDEVTPVESGNGQTGFYYDIQCSLDGAGRIIIPAFTIQSTEDGNLPTSRFTGQLYTQAGAPAQIVFGTNGGQGWAIPTLFGVNVTWADLFRYNQTSVLLNVPPTYATYEQVVELIDARAGMFDYARVGHLGLVEMYDAPDVASEPKAVGPNSYAALGHIGVAFPDVAPTVAVLPKFVGINSPRVTQVYPAEVNGAAPGASGATNTTAIQTTLDIVGVLGGGTVTITTPGTYNLNAQGTNPYVGGHKYCLDFKYDNVEFYLGPGVVLQLANGQQTNAGGPVDMLVFRGRSNLTFSGFGTITGNTAGQTGWSGGYTQVTSGIIISGYGTVGSGGNDHVIVQDLNLIDHFSNPVNIDGTAVRNSNIYYLRLRGSECGEGPQVINTDGVWIDKCFYESPTHVTVGDGIEVSGCTNYHITDAIIKNIRGASAVDVFGSTDGVIDGIVSDDCQNAVVVHAFGGVPDPVDVIVNNIVAKNPRGLNVNSVCDCIELNAGSLTNIKVSNWQIDGTAYSIGMQIVANGAAFGAATNVSVEQGQTNGGTDGILILTALPNLHIKGGSYCNGSGSGIRYVFQANGLSSSNVENLHIEGVTATGNGGFGIDFNNQGFTVPVIVGAINDCMLEDNVSGACRVGNEGLGISVDNVSPNTYTGTMSGVAPDVFALKFVSPTGSDVSTLVHPSKNQLLYVVATQARVIIDRREAGGNNIDLMGGLNFTMAVGDSLSLRYNNTNSRWYEISRSTNGTTVAGVFTSITDSGLTAGRLTFAGTGGLLNDDGDLTFVTDTLSATKVAMSSLTSGRVPIISTAGLLVDDADLTFATDTLTATKLAATASVKVNATGKLSTAPKTNDAWGAAISLDVAISSHDIAAVFGTSATATITPTSAGSAGDWIFINTVNGAGGSVVVTFASTFHSSGTQTTQASRMSSIAFRSDGTRWIEQFRTTDLT